MNKVSPQADLSGWLSPDEERLLALYRNGTEEERNEWLFRVTRRRLAYMFAENFDGHRDACDSSYCREELEQWLREICPRHFLGEYFGEEPAFSTLIGTAWGDAGRVVLGFVERDGQRADEL